MSAPSVTRAGLRRAGSVALAAPAAALTLAPPAWAAGSTIGKPGPSLGLGNTVLVFVVIPLAILFVVGGLAALPSLLRKPRYRTGQAWNADPLWFSGPDNPDRALDAASPARGTGGASADW